MAIDGNMGPVLLSVFHFALLVFHWGSKTADNLIGIFSWKFTLLIKQLLVI